MTKVQIQIVTWNSRPHLERLFRGIDKQSGVDFNVLVIDNASQDGTVEWLNEYSRHAELFSASDPGNRSRPADSAGGMTIKVIINQNNRGFAEAHNQGFTICDAPYVLVLNPDTELQAGYLEEILRVIESGPPPGPLLSKGGRGRVAAVQGKLYRQLPEPPLNPPLGRGGRWGGGIIDSCGLKLLPWGQVVDIGQNQPDKGNFTAQTEVFGVTGACAFYRLEALKKVADKHGIFDARFGAYKEDVDLAWRLQRARWKAVFTPRAAAWHGRGVGRGDVKTTRIRYLSLRNHLLMLWKNLL